MKTLITTNIQLTYSPSNQLLNQFSSQINTENLMQ